MAYRFGTVRLDPERRQLTRDGREQHLSPKAFDLLLALIAARPAVLAKQAIMERVWPDTFVTDASLAVLVREVRAAVGDSARDPQWVRTHHAVGYSFIGEVTEAAPSTEATAAPVAWLAVGDRRVPLAPGETIIGRDASCDLAIADPSVSRRHARIVLDGVRATIEDLGSKNGTLVHGALIDAPAPLGSTAAIRLGAVLVMFAIESPADPSTLTIHTERS